MTNLRALASFGSSLAVLGFVLAIQSFTGCSASPTPNNSPCTSDTDCAGDGMCMDGKCAVESGSSSSGGGSGSGSSGSGSTSSGSVQTPPACVYTCTTAADCADGSNAPALGADNYNCNAGFCEYKGCNSTQECIDTYMMPNYACTPFSGSTVQVCAKTCSSPIDCTTGATIPIYDADNWNCNAGICEYKGCNSTQECDDTYMNTKYECAVLAGGTLKTCVQKCAVPEDCSLGASNTLFDGDNYNCTGGLCEYKGCNTTQECLDSNMKPNYVCK